jgi:hypothetical protein
MISCDMLGRFSVCLLLSVYSLLIGKLLYERIQALVGKRDMEAFEKHDSGRRLRHEEGVLLVMIVSSEYVYIALALSVFGRWASCCYPGRIIDTSKTNIRSL